MAAAAALAPAATAAQPVAHPDAELFRLRDLCMDLHRATDADTELTDTIPYGPRREALWQSIHARVSLWHEAKARLAQLPARTLDGLRAKAAVLRTIVDPGECNNPHPDDELAWSLCRDLLGLNGGSA
ncbi:hypothetical protein ACLIBK_24775 [Roseomonas sp. BN140053]